MSLLQKINTSAITIRVLLIIFFIIMFLLNSLTPYILDDYGYMFNFSTGKMLQSITEIIPSMVTHSRTMNGRIISHGLEQLFMLMPKTVFNICNSGIYTCLILLIYKFASKTKDDAILLIGIFMAIWVFTPMYGQDYLWQVGSVNYLWGIVIGLTFLKPYVDALLYNDIDKPIIVKTLFILISFLAGAYIEGVASIAILGGLILAILVKLNFKKLTWHWLQLASAIIGFIFLISQPAELSKKISSNAFSLSNLIRNIGDLTGIIRDFFLVLITVWVLVLAFSISMKADRNRIMLSLLFFFFAFVSVYEMSIASEISLRCFAFTTVLLIISILFLLNDISNKLIVASLILALSPLFCTKFIIGSIDIYNYYLNVKYRESLINECISNGEYDINIPYIYTKTNYCTTNSTMEISFNCNSWPNIYMAEYYGVSSLTGY